MLVNPTLVYGPVMIAAQLALIITFSLWTQNYLNLDTTLTPDNYVEAWTN